LEIDFPDGCPVIDEMRAWLLKDFTGLSALAMAQLADPKPKANEVILQMRFAGLNPADRYLSEKQYPAKPPLPHILGRDGLGTVLELGSNVTDIPIGALRAVSRGEVGVNSPGTFAERVAVPTEDLISPPESWAEQEAAGATLVYLTAYQALTMWGPVQPGSVVLVTGASGGVGVACVQLASAMGCNVVGLSRSPEKSRRLLELGATLALNPGDSQWRHQAKSQLAPKKVDLAVDNIGGKLLPEVLDTLGDLGRVSVVGRLAGPVPEFNTASLFFRRLRIGGVAVGAYTKAESRQAWADIVALLAKTKQRPIVDSIFPFDQLPQAFDRLAKGPMGKVLLQIGS
jgi:NADPH2:quinone reductase